MNYTPIILFSTIENRFNKILNIILWSVNFWIFGGGSYIIITNFENLNTSIGIQDCGNIMPLIGFTVLNSLLIMIGFFKYLFISIFTFSSSIILITYQIINLQNISNECNLYYTKNYNNIWIFHNISIVLLGFNILIYFIKYLNFLSLNTNDILKEKIQPQIVNKPENTMLDNDDNLITHIDFSNNYRNGDTDNMYESID
tara:strand:+ start:23 stop:622 length:600 start_codon:yes stop_codon:yes gene_type:complete